MDQTVQSNTECIVDSQQISLIEDALNDHTYHLVRFRKIPKCYKIGDKVKLSYKVHSSYLPKSADWIGLFAANWISPFHYITFEWAESDGKPRNGNTREIEFSLDKIMLPKSSKCQFLYISSDNAVIGASPVFEIQGQDTSKNDAHTTGFVITGSSGSCDSMATKSDSEGSFEFLEDCGESSETDSPSSLESPVIEDLAKESTVVPSEKSSDHISLTDSCEPKGESIYNWLRCLEEEEGKNNGKLEDQKVTKSVLGPIEETDENNNVQQNLNVPYPVSCLENLKTLSFTQLQLNSLSQQLCKELAQVSSSQLKGMMEELQGQLKTLQPNPEVASAVLPGTAVSCQCEKEILEMVQDRSRLQKRLTKVCIEKRCLTAKLQENEDVSEFRKVLLDRLTELTKTLMLDRDSLQVANNMLNKRISSMEQTAALKKKDKVRLAASASTVPKLSSEITALKDQITALTTVKEMGSERLPQLERENEKLQRNLADMKKQHAELQDHYEDILHTLSMNGVTGVVRKNNDGNMTLVSTRKDEHTFNVTSNGLQAINGQILELESWRHVKNKRTTRHLHMISRQQDKIENLSAEMEGLNDNLKNEMKIVSQLRNQLKASETENKVLREKSEELEGINTFLVQTVNMLSGETVTLPITSSAVAMVTGTNCNAASNQDCKKECLKPLFKSTTSHCDASTSTCAKTSSLDAATNTTVIKTASSWTNTAENHNKLKLTTSEMKTTDTKSRSFNFSARPPPCKVKFTHTMPTFATPEPSFPTPGCSNHACTAQPCLNDPLIPRTDKPKEDQAIPEVTFLPAYSVPLKPEEPKHKPGAHFEKWASGKAKKTFANVNFSANPESNKTTDATEDMVQWGINTLTSFANMCDTEIKNLCNFLEHLLKTENCCRKKPTTEELVEVINETPQRQEKIKPPHSIVHTTENPDDANNSIYCDFDFD